MVRVEGDPVQIGELQRDDIDVASLARMIEPERVSVVAVELLSLVNPRSEGIRLVMHNPKRQARRLSRRVGHHCPVGVQ